MNVGVQLELFDQSDEFWWTSKLDIKLSIDRIKFFSKVNKCNYMFRWRSLFELSLSCRMEKIPSIVLLPLRFPD